MKTKTIPTLDLTCLLCGMRFAVQTPVRRVQCPRCSCALDSRHVSVQTKAAA